MTSRRCVEAASAPLPRCCSRRYSPQRLVSLSHCSCCLTSCPVDGLLTPCGGQRDACRMPTGRPGRHAHALHLQATETVTEGALGTGQRRSQRRVTPRSPPPGPRRIGRPPPSPTLREWGETPRRPHGSPALRVARRVSAGAAAACVSPASRAAWPGASRWSARRPSGRRPVRTVCPSAWTATRSTAVRWLLHGACGTPWLAGTVPWVLHRVLTVALTPNCCAACWRVNPSVPCGTCGRRYCYRTPAPRGARQVFPVPVREPRRLSVAAMVTSRQTCARARRTARLAASVARPCLPAVGRATRHAGCPPPCQGRGHRGAGGSWVVWSRRVGRTVRRRRCVSASGAAA